MQLVKNADLKNVSVPAAIFFFNFESLCFFQMLLQPKLDNLLSFFRIFANGHYVLITVLQVGHPKCIFSLQRRVKAPGNLQCAK